MSVFLFVHHYGSQEGQPRYIANAFTDTGITDALADSIVNIFADNVPSNQGLA